MADEWPRRSVVELQTSGVLFVEDGNHGHDRPRRPEFGAGEWAFIRAADMDAGRVLFDSAERINDLAIERIRKGFGKPGDILFSHKGTVGKLALVPLDAPRFVCSPQTTYWRTLDTEQLDRRFLYYYMQSGEFVGQWSAVKGETDMADYVSLTAQRRFVVPFPPIDVQRAIGCVLGTLDDTIEHNRRTARALELLARAVFRAWFVDFEPVKAKAAGATTFPSVPQAIFDALPIRFVDSAIGPVPEGWAVQSLAEIATFLNGLALQKYPPRNDGNDLRVIKIAELRKGTAESAALANSDVPSEYVIDDRDLLFSWSGTLEAEFWFGGKGALNQHLFKVTSSYFPIWYCLLWIREHLPWFRAIAASKATTMGHIKRGHLQEAQVVVPPAAVVREADHALGPLYDLQAQLMIESRKLGAMRDYLLPKLLSGDAWVAATQGEGAERA